LTHPIFPGIPIATDPRRRLQHAKFDHDAHRGFSCVSCHEKALTSAGMSDVLLPGIATCKACHAPGPERAESRCFECHTYHDWATRKEVKATFTVPSLRTTGN
jgi:transcription elongation factor Elf1